MSKPENTIFEVIADMESEKKEPIVLNAADGAEAVIEKLNELARKGGYVYRGYDIQDELLPNIMRIKPSIIDVEAELLYLFEKYGSNYINASSPIDFMSYAQHFGLPTRLLDFTYNPFIALSFALNKRKDGKIYDIPEDNFFYYIRYAVLDDNLCSEGIPLSDDDNAYGSAKMYSLAARACRCIDSATDLFMPNNTNISSRVLNEFRDASPGHMSKADKIKNRKILFLDPNQSNQRIIMQQGLFMFPYTLNKKEHFKIIKDNTQCIMIHKDLRNELVNYLDTLGYNLLRLTPDLPSICAGIRRFIIDYKTEMLNGSNYNEP